jgi:hypothetical protein
MLKILTNNLNVIYYQINSFWLKKKKNQSVLGWGIGQKYSGYQIKTKNRLLSQTKSDFTLTLLSSVSTKDNNRTELLIILCK